MKAVFWFGVLVIIFGGIAGYQLMHFRGNLDSSVVAAPPAAQVMVGGVTLDVFVADTPQEQNLGLGGREALLPDQGMLFVFPESGMHTFWMKDMHFSIDILWIGENGTIVSMLSSVSPETYPKVFAPKESARYVLETNAGFVAQHDIREGDIVYVK